MTKRVSATPVSSLTLDEALEERRVLVEESHDIQAQLGDRNKMVEGRRMSETEYNEWRSKAVHALNVRQTRMAALKEHVRKLRAAASVTEAGITDTSDLGLLRSCSLLLRKLAREGVEFEPGEQAVLDVVRARLQHGSPS